MTFQYDIEEGLYWAARALTMEECGSSNIAVRLMSAHLDPVLENA